MKAILSTLLVFLCLLGGIYVTFVQFPSERKQTYVTQKPVHEQRLREQTFQVEIDGRLRDVTVPMPYTVTKMAPETHERTVYPTKNEWLIFIARVIGLSIICYYTFPLITILLRDKWSNQKRTATTRDTEQRVDGMIRFVVGVIMGFVFAVDSGQQPNTLPVQIADDGSILIPIDPPPLSEVIESPTESTYSDAPIVD